MEGSPPTRVGGGGGGKIERIPEECISLVLSLTSPRDVCRSSAVSKTFLSAAESDIAWDRFLRPELKEILRRSSSPVASSSKRDLYFRLCDPENPIPIDDSKVLWFEKATGRKCYMLSARALGITWGDDTRYWKWISVPNARFPEVAVLRDVCWLEIRASIKSRDLSPDTGYGAYLVMQLSDSAYGLEEPRQETEISVGGVHASTRSVRLQDRRAGHLYQWTVADPFDEGGTEEEEEFEEEEEEEFDEGGTEEEEEEVEEFWPLSNEAPAANEATVVEAFSPDNSPREHHHAEAGQDMDQTTPSPGGQVEQPPEGRREEGVCVPRARGDGWMELEMGDFFVEAGGEELVEVRLKGWHGPHWKSGLIVHGIELRPICRGN